MERQNLMGPYDLHLQWFGDPPPDPPPAPSAGPEPKPPAGPEPKPPVGPEPKPPAAPEPELKADGTFLAQAPDKYKKDQKFLKDLLQHKSWGEVLDRLYVSEGKLTELQAKLAPIPQKPEEYQFDELKFPDYLAGDQLKELRDNLSRYLKSIDDSLRTAGLTKEGARAESNRARERVFAQQKAAQDAENEAHEKGLKALKEVWKGDFAAREDIARRAILTFGKDKLVATLAKRGLENDPEIIETFERIGAAIGEGQLVPGKPGPAVPTKEQAKAAANKARYPRSPELTGEPAPAGAGVDQAALDRLAKRYPQQAKEKKQ